MEIIFDYCCKRNCWMWYKDSCFASAVKHAWWRIATRNMLCSHYPGAVCLCTLCTRTNTAQEKHALINLTFLLSPTLHQWQGRCPPKLKPMTVEKNTMREIWQDSYWGKQDPVLTMQKNAWTKYSSFLVWKKSFTLDVWSLGGTQQPFSCELGHFRHGDNQPNKQTNNQLILEQASS